MSASDHLHPYQMSLFMQAKDLMDMKAGHTESGVYHPFSQSHLVHAEKLREAKSGSPASTFFPRKRGQDSLYESIQKKGVTSPVSVWVKRDGPNGEWTEQINDGHHRIAAAHDINPEMYIPVEYR